MCSNACWALGLHPKLQSQSCNGPGGPVPERASGRAGPGASVWASGLASGRSGPGAGGEPRANCPVAGASWPGDRRVGKLAGEWTSGGPWAGGGAGGPAAGRAPGWTSGPRGRRPGSERAGRALVWRASARGRRGREGLGSGRASGGRLLSMQLIDSDSDPLIIIIRS